MLPNALRPSATDHVPVLADEVRRLLDVEPGKAVVDATFGAGGHAELLAHDLRGNGRFIAVDRDPSARQYFERFRKRAGVQARFLRGEFATVLDQLATNDVRVDAILLDLGVSSMQLDRPERGFRTPSTRRSTCAWTCPRRRQPPTSSTMRRSESCSRSSAATARSVTRARLLVPSSAAGGASRLPARASSST